MLVHRLKGLPSFKITLSQRTVFLAKSNLTVFTVFWQKSANTIIRDTTNVGLMLAHRLRRWTNIKPTLFVLSCIFWESAWYDVTIARIRPELSALQSDNRAPPRYALAKSTLLCRTHYFYLHRILVPFHVMRLLNQWRAQHYFYLEEWRHLQESYFLSSWGADPEWW